MPTDEKLPPEVIAFEGRCYRLDRIAAVKPSDVRVAVDERKPYAPPVLRHLGSVHAITAGPVTGDSSARKKAFG